MSYSDPRGNRHYPISPPVETKGDGAIAADASSNEEHNDFT